MPEKGTDLYRRRKEETRMDSFYRSKGCCDEYGRERESFNAEVAVKMVHPAAPIVRVRRPRPYHCLKLKSRFSHSP